MFDPTTLTGIHTWISLIAIALGLPAVAALFRTSAPTASQGVFLLLAFLASATGFLFPFSRVLPSHVVGVIAILVLAAGAFAWVRHLAGWWRTVYAGSVVVSLYLLVFVGIAQAFAKIPALRASAPTQSEPPFAVAQGAVLLAFLVVGIAAARARRVARAVAG